MWASPVLTDIGGVAVFGTVMTEVVGGMYGDGGDWATGVGYAHDGDGSGYPIRDSVKYRIRESVPGGTLCRKRRPPGQATAIRCRPTYGGFMAATATVHVYFDDGTYLAVKVHDPGMGKHPAPEPPRRPVRFRHGRRNPADTVYETTGSREWGTSDKGHIPLSHTGHDVGSCRLPTREGRDAGRRSWPPY